MLYACVQRIDVMKNLEKIWKLDKALLCNRNINDFFYIFIKVKNI